MNQDLLNEVISGQILTKDQSLDLLLMIINGQYNEHQIASILGALNTRMITAPELSGFREALLSVAIPIDLSGLDTVDICGTGGDGKNTFNISTIAAFIVAGAGIKVAKHGNYASSSLVGSSNVLESLGVPFAKTEAHAQRLIEDTGICFLHAPFFHPSLKPLGPLRKSLGFRTIFNMLGPLCNPARPKHKVLGVSNKHLHRLYSTILSNEGDPFAVVSSLDGYDEISLTTPTTVTTESYQRNLSAKDFGFNFPHLSPQELLGANSSKEAAILFSTILEGRGTSAQRAVTIANASIAIERCMTNRSLKECVAKATESLESGAALRVLKKLSEIQL